MKNFKNMSIWLPKYVISANWYFSENVSRNCRYKESTSNWDVKYWGRERKTEKVLASQNS